MIGRKASQVGEKEIDHAIEAPRWTEQIQKTWLSVYSSNVAHERVLSCLATGKTDETDLILMQVVGKARNDSLTHTLIDYLMGETDNVPKERAEPCIAHAWARQMPLQSDMQ